MTDVADEARLRERIVHIMRAMAVHGLNRGTSGNVSARCGNGMLITPTGIVPEELTPDSIVLVDATGQSSIRATGEGIPRETGQTAANSLKPSSEWRMHQRILARRPDANAVVHCHSRFATILACAGKPIPAMHYMIGVSGGTSVPVAPYAVFGSVELADAVADTLEGRNACLMANHGQIALASSLGRALAIAEEIEEQAAIYWGTLAIGGPTLLNETQMQEIFTRFRSYGQ